MMPSSFFCKHFGLLTWLLSSVLISQYYLRRVRKRICLNTFAGVISPQEEDSPQFIHNLDFRKQLLLVTLTI
jgi:hypothetical protein